MERKPDLMGSQRIALMDWCQNKGASKIHDKVGTGLLLQNINSELKHIIS